MARHAYTQQPLSLSNPIRPQRTTSQAYAQPKDYKERKLLAIGCGIDIKYSTFGIILIVF